MLHGSNFFRSVVPQTRKYYIAAHQKSLPTLACKKSTLYYRRGRVEFSNSTVGREKNSVFFNMLAIKSNRCYNINSKYCTQIKFAFYQSNACNQTVIFMKELKTIIAENLVSLRKSAGLTQQELASKLNYSDKAVSKWERGESIPDVIVLKQIADMYGVKVDDFFAEHEQHALTVVPHGKNVAAKHLLVTLLSVGLVFLVATIVMVVWLLINPEANQVAAYCYLTALPVASIVALVFCCLWGKIWHCTIAVSTLVWTLCILMHKLLAVQKMSWLIYLVGAALQALVLLWFLLKYVLKKAKKQ